MSSADAIRVARIVESLTPIPSATLCNGRARWTVAFIELFERVVNTLDDGKFAKLLGSSSLTQAKFPSLLSVSYDLISYFFMYMPASQKVCSKIPTYLQQIRLLELKTVDF